MLLVLFFRSFRAILRRLGSDPIGSAGAERRWRCTKQPEMKSELAAAVHWVAVREARQPVET
jgi:hypothetical protein